MNFQRHNRETFGDARPRNPPRVPIVTKVPEASGMTIEKWAGVALIVLIRITVVIFSYRKGVQDYEAAERQKLLLEGNPSANRARIEGSGNNNKKKNKKNDKRKKIKTN